MFCFRQGDNKKALVAAVIATGLLMHGTAYAAAATPVPNTGAGAGAKTTPNAAPNSGMIPNTGSGMITNTGSGSPTNPTDAAPEAPMNPAVNPANQPNGVNPVNPNNPNVVNGVPNNPANPTATGNAANWPAQDRFWREHFSSQPYATSNTTFAMYEPAYQFGVNLFNETGGQQQFSSMNLAQLKQAWQQQNGGSNLTWEQAEPAVRDAYDRVQQEQPNNTATPVATP